jgi:LPXTG-motif cell wall-anchored protein
VFRTNFLGAFVISSEEIVDFNYDPDGDAQISPEPTPTGDNPGGTQNPVTGAATTGTVIALALTSLAGAGAVARKRRSR